MPSEKNHVQQRMSAGISKGAWIARGSPAGRGMRILGVLLVGLIVVLWTSVSPAISPPRSANDLSWETYRERLNMPMTQWRDADAPIAPADVELQRIVEEELEKEARKGDPARIAMLLSFHALALENQHRWKESIADFEHADALLQTLPQSEWQRALIAYEGAGALLQMSELRKAIAVLQDSLDGLRNSVPAANILYADSLELLGHAYCRLQDCRKGITSLLKAQEIYRTAHDPASLSILDYYLAEALFTTGQLVAAEAANTEALQLDEEAQIGVFHAAILFHQKGQILAEQQRQPEAQHAFQQAIDLFQTLPGHEWDAQRCHAGVAAALYAQGQVDQARTLAEQLLAAYAEQTSDSIEDWELSNVAYILGLVAQSEHNFQSARLRLYQSWRIRTDLLITDALTVQRGLEVAALLRGKPNWAGQRDHIFEWLYPRLSDSSTPLLSKLQVLHEWSEILRTRGQRATAAAVTQQLQTQCASPQAREDKEAVTYCMSLTSSRA